MVNKAHLVQEVLDCLYISSKKLLVIDGASLQYYKQHIQSALRLTLIDIFRCQTSMSMQIPRLQGPKQSVLTHIYEHSFLLITRSVSQKG